VQSDDRVIDNHFVPIEVDDERTDDDTPLVLALTSYDRPQPIEFRG
jgi:hypothetical protein